MKERYPGPEANSKPARGKANAKTALPSTQPTLKTKRQPKITEATAEELDDILEQEGFVFAEGGEEEAQPVGAVVPAICERARVASIAHFPPVSSSTTLAFAHSNSEIKRMKINGNGSNSNLL